jgi:hypothetical protein
VIDGERIAYVENHRSTAITFAVPALGIIFLAMISIFRHGVTGVNGIVMLSVFCAIGALFGSLALFFAGAKRTLVIDRDRATIEFRLFGRFVESVQAPRSEIACMRQICWVKTRKARSVMDRVTIRVGSDFVCIAEHNDSELVDKHILVLENVSGLSVVSGPPATD